jgi:hypothetical protein
MIRHPVECRIRKNEVRRLRRKPGDIFFYLGNDRIECARFGEHFLGCIDPRDVGIGPSFSQLRRDVAGAATEIKDSRRRLELYAREQVKRRLDPVALEP